MEPTGFDVHQACEAVRHSAHTLLINQETEEEDPTLSADRATAFVATLTLEHVDKPAHWPQEDAWKASDGRFDAASFQCGALVTRITRQMAKHGAAPDEAAVSLALCDDVRGSAAVEDAVVATHGTGKSAVTTLYVRLCKAEVAPSPVAAPPSAAGELMESPEFFNWVQTMVGLSHVDDVLRLVTTVAANSLHALVRRELAATVDVTDACATCVPFIARRPLTPCVLCRTWAAGFTKYHKGGSYGYRNCDTRGLPKHPWEGVKLFMKWGSQTARSAEGTDTTALLSFIDLCTAPVWGKLNKAKVLAVRSAVRNRTMHSASRRLTAEQAADMVALMATAIKALMAAGVGTEEEHAAIKASGTQALKELAAMTQGGRLVLADKAAKYAADTPPLPVPDHAKLLHMPRPLFPTVTTALSSFNAAPPPPAPPTGVDPEGFDTPPLPPALQGAKDRAAYVGDGPIKLLGMLFPEDATPGASTLAVVQAALSGFGGVGKTETATQVAKMVAERDLCPSGIYWLLCDSVATLYKSLSDLAAAIPSLRPYASDNDPVVLAARVRDWFSSPSRAGFLLVCDNVDRRPVLQELVDRILPVTATFNGKVVVTSRLSEDVLKDVLHGVVPSTVSRLSQPQAEKLLWIGAYGVQSLEAFVESPAAAGRDPDEEAAAVRTLASPTHLDGLPLALQHAGAYVREREASFCKYLGLFDGERSVLLRVPAGRKAYVTPATVETPLEDWLPCVDVDLVPVLAGAGLGVFGDLMGKSAAEFEDMGVRPASLAATLVHRVDLARDEGRRCISTTFAVSMAEVSPRSANAMSVLSMGAPEGVPAALLLKALPYLGDACPALRAALQPEGSLRRRGRGRRAAAAGDTAAHGSWLGDVPLALATKVESIMEELAAHSLIAWDNVTGTASMHRLVQLVQQDAVLMSLSDVADDDVGAAEADAAIKGLADMLPERLCEAVPYKATMGRWRQLLPHVDAAANLTELGVLSLGVEGETLADVLLRGAGAHLDFEATPQAVALVDAAEKLVAAAREDGSPLAANPDIVSRETSAACLRVGIARQSGREQDGDKLAAEAEAIARVTFEGGEVRFGVPLRPEAVEDLARCLSQVWVWTGGQEVLQKQPQVAALFATIPPRPTLAAHLHLDHVIGLHRMSRYAEAFTVWQQADAELNKTAEAGHPLRLLAAKEEAMLLFRQGRIGASLAKFDAVLGLWKETLGGDVDNREIATALNTKGTILARQGRLEAFEYFEPALQMRRRIYGDKPNRDVGTTLVNIGSLLLEQGRLPLALQHLNDALAMFRDVFPNDNNRGTGYIHDLLGRVYSKQGRLEDALAMHQRALEIFHLLYGDTADHNSIAAAMHGVAAVYTRQEKHAEALAMHQKAADMVKRVFGEGDTPNLALSLGKVALALVAMKDAEGAFRVATEAYGMAVRVYEEGVDHRDVATLLDGVGRAHLTAGNVEEAQEAHEAALTMASRVFSDQDHDDVVACMMNIADALWVAGKQSAAEALYEDAAGMRRRLVTGDFGGRDVVVRSDGWDAGGEGGGGGWDEGDGTVGAASGQSGNWME